MKIPRHWQLLLAGVRLQPTSTDLHNIQKELGASGVDWDSVVDRAFEHDIAPLMYRTLQGLPQTDHTKAAFARLRSAYMGNAARNALLFRELHVVLRALRERRKDVIVLKGAALAETVYRDRALRPMSDVDLLVRKADLAESEEILKSLGYRLSRTQESAREWYSTNHYHFALFKEVSPALGVCLEIHWLLERPRRFPIDTEGVWERAVAARIGDVPAFVLCPEDLLLHLCLHTCKHRLTGGFRAFCDIAEVIREFGLQMNWMQVVSRASEWRINTFVAVPLHLTQKFLDALVPEWVIEAMMPPGFDHRLLEAVAARVFEDRLAGTLFQDFFLLRHGNSLGERASVVQKVFSRAAIASRYGLSADSAGIFRYYPRRAKDLIIDYGAELWRFLMLGRQASQKAADRRRLGEWLKPFAEGTAEDDS